MSSTKFQSQSQQGTMPFHKNMQGIVSILWSDDRDKVKVAVAPLRRTLSADMSSWLSQNTPQSLPMKKTASSEQLQHSKVTTYHQDSFSSSSEEEDVEGSEVEKERVNIWIQMDKKAEEAAKLETWSSIFSSKVEEENSNSILTPYIHPLVKRSKSALSEKSLEICTESLGSETGSDVVLFSSSSDSNQSETEEDSDKEEEKLEELVAKQSLHVAKKSMPRCFPPPLPSLHNMRSHRGQGRLFLEASKQSNKLCAQRQDGRLVLTFESSEEEEDGDDEKNSVFGLEEEFFVGFEEDDDYEEAEEDKAPFLSSMKKNKAIEGGEHVVAHSLLPPRPKVNNGYDDVSSSGSGDVNWTSRDGGQQLVVMRGKNGGYNLVHSSNSCKDSRRSFLFWGPHCIAT